MKTPPEVVDSDVFPSADQLEKQKTIGIAYIGE